MNSNTSKFLGYLALLMLAVGLLGWLGTCFVAEEAMQSRALLSQISHLLYYFTPAFAVFFVEKWEVKRVLREYKLTFKGINTKSFYTYTLATLFLFPVIIFLCIAIFGDGCQIDSFGKIIGRPIGNHNITFPGGLVFKQVCFGQLILFAYLMSFVGSFIFALFNALGGEIGWRGFLENNIHLPHFKKYLLIGIIWGLWSIAPILARGIGDRGADALFYASGTTLLMCIVSSFYLASALKRTGTLWAPIWLQGIILSTSMLFLLVDGGNYALIGSSGLLAVVSIFILDLLFARKKPA